MSLTKIINKIDCLLTAIESIEVLIQDHQQEVLKPILIHLQAERKKAAQSIAFVKISEENEQVKRLSHH